MLDTYRRVKQQRDAAEIDGGFTLIELLIVIVVLGILAAVVVFSLGSVTGNAAKASCQTDVASVNTAEAAYYAQNGSYTTTQTNLTAVNTGSLQTWPTNSHYTISVAVATASVSINVAPGDITVEPLGGGAAKFYTPTAQSGGQTTFANACNTVT